MRIENPCFCASLASFPCHVKKLASVALVPILWNCLTCQSWAMGSAQNIFWSTVEFLMEFSVVATNITTLAPVTKAHRYSTKPSFVRYRNLCDRSQCFERTRTLLEFRVLPFLVGAHHLLVSVFYIFNSYVRSANWLSSRRVNFFILLYNYECFFITLKYFFPRIYGST